MHVSQTANSEYWRGCVRGSMHVYRISRRCRNWPNCPKRSHPGVGTKRLSSGRPGRNRKASQGGYCRWYRILRGDGKVVLKGWSSSSELEQTAGGNVGRTVFAIRIAEAADSRSAQSVFKRSDLKTSHVAVYQATNGHRIFSIGVRDLVPAVQTFAISPREDQMAIVKAGEIIFYRVSAGE